MIKRTLADEIEEDAQFGADVWQEALADNLALLLERGRVPGIVAPSRHELRKFFEQETDAGYWMRLSQIDPKEAMGQLQQWAALQGGTDEV